MTEKATDVTGCCLPSRLIGRGLIWLVKLYRNTLARFLGGQCRFQPSCSEYFIDAVRLRGPLVGAALGLWRIVRCNPLSKGGFDPVPPPRNRGTDND